MRKLVSGALVVAGVMSVPAGRTAMPNVAESQHSADRRLVILQRFFQERDCPINKFARDFLEAADQNGLDWRLLPSISLLESGGGKDYEKNNIFGWDNCKQNFPSIRDGIHAVAERLANSRLYHDKNLDDLLRTYNPARPDYPRRVKSVMSQISAEPSAVDPALN